jgi:hypothetical protein
VPLTNAERQQRCRARKRHAKDERNKLIIGARLGALSTKQRVLAAAALSAVSDILTGKSKE